MLQDVVDAVNVQVIKKQAHRFLDEKSTKDY